MHPQTTHKTPPSSKMPLGPILHLLLLALACSLHLRQAQAGSYHMGSAVRLASVSDRTSLEQQQQTTTTTVMPTSSIEDPSNSDTSEASAATSSETNDDNYCFGCYEKLKQAKQLIAIQLNLVNTINKLVRQKSKALASANNSSASHRPKRNQRNSSNNNVSNMTRSLMNHLSTNTATSESPNKPTSVLVSTLRVARAASPDLQPPFEINRRTNSSKITKDPVLKQLGHKKEQQLVETCKMIYDVQSCLSDLSGECLGNLQYHSQDVYIRQWFGKLDCRRTNTTRSGWFAGLTRSLPIVEEQEKVPKARNNSSEEKVNERISDLLGLKPIRPFAVELKPHGFRLGPQYHPLSYDPNDPNNEIYFRDWRYQLLLPCFLVLMIIAIGLRNLRREPFV